MPVAGERGWALAALAVCGLCAGAPATAAAPAAAPGPDVTVSVSPSEVTLGAGATVTGAVTAAGAALPGAAVELQGELYPYGAWSTVASAVSGAGGGFAFPALRPDRDMRLRVVLTGGGGASAPLALIVNPRVSIGARSLGPGRTLLSLRIRHLTAAGTRDGQVRWFLSPRGSRVFRLAAVTAATELRPGLLSATVTVNPPARRFAFRACVNPSWERAMGPASSHRPCPRFGFVLPSGHAR